MQGEERKSQRLSSNAYLGIAEHMHMMAARANTAETRSEFAKLAKLYEKLAARVTKGTYMQAEAPPLERYQGIALLPLQETYFHYDRESVAAHAPSAPGVYALWKKDFWIYVGECQDIQRHLLAHLSDDNECIASVQPTAFGFELVDDPVERVARQAALIRDLMPIC